MRTGGAEDAEDERKEEEAAEEDEEADAAEEVVEDSPPAAAVVEPPPMLCQQLHEGEGGMYGCTLPAYHEGEHSNLSLLLWPPPKSCPIARPAFSVGDRVLARYMASRQGPHGTKWFRGQVAAIHSNGTYEITFEDGDSETNVLPKYVRSDSGSTSISNGTSAAVAGQAGSADATSTVRPADVDVVGEHAQVGDWLRAKDRIGVWCDAKVVKVRSGHAAVRELRVHFHQWNSRFDEWIRVGEGRLQSGGAQPQGTQAPDDAAESEDEAESYDTVSISWERVSTRCAVSAQRLDDPAKGCHCNHRAKINYALLCTYVSRTCPILGCDMRIASKQRIERDHRLRQLLAEVPSHVTEVWMHGDQVSVEPPSVGQERRKRPRADDGGRAHGRTRSFMIE